MKFRLKLFFYHLAISLIIGITTLLLVYGVWHPSPLAKAVGVTYIFLMMLAIDVALGPILTLLVAKKDKKSLKFDLAVIFVVQMAALAYGVHNIAAGRPVYMAYDSGRIDLVQANNIPKEELVQATMPYNTLGLGRPKFIAVKKPTETSDNSDRLFVELETGVSPAMRPTLYEPIETQYADMRQQSKPLQELQQYNSSSALLLEKHPEAVSFLPLMAYAEDMTVLLDASGMPVAVVDLRPW